MKNLTEAAKVIPFKRKKDNKKLAAIMGLGVLTAFIALFTPWFNIKAIEVKGNSQLKQDEIINMAGIPLEQNIFRVNYFKAKRNIKQNLYIEKVDISKDLPNKVVINIQERVRTGYISIKGNNYIIDKNRMVLGVVNNATGIGAPLILGIKFKEYKLGEELEPEEQDKLKCDLLMKCFNEFSFGNKLSKIDVSNLSNIVVWACNDKYQINLGDENNLAYKIKFAKTVVEKQEKDKGPSGVISFSAENRVIFKLR